jgi:hypothetical protein
MYRDIGLKVRILDDRGNGITVTGRANREWDIFRASLLDGSIYNELTRSKWKLLGWMVLCGAATLLIAAIMVFFASGIPTLGKLLCLIVAAAVIFRITAINTARRWVLQSRVRKLVSCGLCPSCNYVLGGIPPGEDGFVVCPECSSSWRHAEPPLVGAGNVG